MLFTRDNSVQELVGAHYLHEWSVGTRLTISSAAQVHQVLKKSTYFITLYSESDIYFLFSTGATDANSANNDLIVKQLTPMSINVPRGIAGLDMADLIYFHVQQVTSVATKYVRWVEH